MTKGIWAIVSAVLSKATMAAALVPAFCGSNIDFGDIVNISAALPDLPCGAAASLLAKDNECRLEKLMFRPFSLFVPSPPSCSLCSSGMLVLR